MLLLPTLVHHLKIITSLSFVSFCLAMLLTPIYTHYAFKHKWWKRSRTHTTTGEALTVIAQMRIKRSLPLMAGMVMLVAITAVTVTANFTRGQTWLPLAALLGGGAVGLLDDIINVRGGGGNVAGIRAPLKLALVTLVSGLCAWFFYFRLHYASIIVPFAGSVHIGWLLIPLAMLVIVSTGNAVNITDGMDGLAGGLLISTYMAFGVIAVLQTNYGIAGFCLTVVGALLSYVWFNIPPARFLMGDVGSFSLGTALGAVAIMCNAIFVLPVIALVFVVEAGSSLLQITSKKTLHRKIFIAAPIHHHFEAKGWPKTKVTMRFWIIGQVCGILGVILALAGGYIK